MNQRPADIAIEWARAALRERLSAEGAAHSERTASAARALAGRHGVAPDLAEIAGLLHDWSRDETPDALLAFAEARGLAILPEERAHPELLHARVGAERLRTALPGIALDVLSAVAAHTVGSVPMSALDKVVYIADKVEAGRDYPGVERLRELAGSASLDEAFREAYLGSVAHVGDHGRELHPVTASVLASIGEPAGRSSGRSR